MEGKEWSEPLPPLPAEYLVDFASPLLATSPRTHPERWQRDGTDPCDADEPSLYGEVLSDAEACMFVSDLHMSDDGSAGDDFLHDHLVLARIGGQVLAVAGSGGASKGAPLGRALALCRNRVQTVVGPDARLDLVLNGDIIDLLEMQGRGFDVLAETPGLPVSLSGAPRPGCR